VSIRVRGPDPTSGDPLEIIASTTITQIDPVPAGPSGTPDKRLSDTGTELPAGAAPDVTAKLRFVLATTNLPLPDPLTLVTGTPGRILGRDTTLRLGTPAAAMIFTVDGSIQCDGRHGPEVMPA